MWASALQYALNRLYAYTPARPPSRTLVDPLAAFIDAFADVKGLDEAVATAAAATEATKDILAKAGRATYVERSRLKGVADAGATGVTVILEAISQALRS